MVVFPEFQINTHWEDKIALSVQQRHLKEISMQYMVVVVFEEANSTMGWLVNCWLFKIKTKKSKAFIFEFYLKTGHCKYGPTCKYHHPKNRQVDVSVNMLGYQCGRMLGPVQLDHENMDMIANSIIVSLHLPLTSYLQLVLSMV